MSGLFAAWASWADFGADLVWRTSWQAGLLAAAVAVVALFWRSIPSGARLVLWWLVCLKFVAGLVWTQPIAVPLLPPDVNVRGFSPTSQGLSSIESHSPLGTGSSAPWSQWPSVLMAFWLASIAGQIWLSARQLRRTRTLVAGALPAELELRSQCQELSERAGLRGVPALRVSADIDTPQVTGLLHPTILLPATVASWSDADRSMALAHEILHIRRKDLWYGLIPSIADRLFFFHPLARLAAREYVLAREAGCDTQTIALLDADPAEYGQLLLRFGIMPGALPAIGGASTTFRMLKRRLVMLQDSQARARQWSWRWWAVAAVVAVVVVPFQLTALVADAPEPAPLAAQDAQSRSRVEAAERQLEAERLALEARQRALQQEAEDIAAHAQAQLLARTQQAQDEVQRLVGAHLDVEASVERAKALQQLAERLTRERVEMNQLHDLETMATVERLREVQERVRSRAIEEGQRQLALTDEARRTQEEQARKLTDLAREMARRRADESQQATDRARALRDRVEETREQARRSADVATLANQQRDELLRRLAQLQAEMDRIRQQLR